MKVETAKKDPADTDGASCSSQTVEDHAELKRKLEWKCEGAREVRLVLQDSGLWRRFHEIGTEMIITKAGRRMFPSVRVRVDHLDPLQLYDIAMDIVPVDYKRYRYAYHTSQWLVAGHTRDWCVSPHLCVHPDSPSSGKTWMRHVITFDRVKLTNNLMDDKGHVVLKSMHRYRPRVHVIARACDSGERLSSLPKDGVITFSFPETQFTTVTAYQNQQITQLKIDKNPFAKGFKEPANRGMLNQILEPWSSPFKPVTKRVPADTQVSGSWAASSDFWSSAEHHTMFFCPQHWYTSPHPICSSQSELMVLSGIHDPFTVLMEHRGRPLQDTPDGRTSLFESHLFSCAFPLTHRLLQLQACRSSPAVHHYLLPLIQHHSQFSSEQPNISLFFS